jgi:hypothetical protein
LNLKYGGPLSNFALNFNLHRYDKDTGAAAAAAAAMGLMCAAATAAPTELTGAWQGTVD